MALYLRQYNLIIGKNGGSGIQLTGAQIQFKIDKTNTSENNKMNLKIYNLNQTHRMNLITRDTVVYFKAGYAGAELQTLFGGTIIDAKTTKEGVDYITEINLGDSNLQLRQARSSRSFEGGTKLQTVVVSMVDDFNKTSDEKIAIQELSGEDLNYNYQNGITIYGPTKQAMDRLLNGKNLQWCINDFGLIVTPKQGSNKQSAVFLSASTGMIGSPEFQNFSPDQLSGAVATNNTGAEKSTITQNGIRAKSLLNPNIIPTRKIVVNSTNIKGKIFTVQKVTHDGDFRSNEWTTSFEATDAN